MQTFPTAESLKANDYVDPAYIVVDDAPVSAEKPFISVDADDRYHLNIPKVGGQLAAAVCAASKDMPVR
jgi:hypothetical protein